MHIKGYTTITGESVLINLDKINLIRPHRDGCTVFLDCGVDITITAPPSDISGYIDTMRLNRK